MDAEVAPYIYQRNHFTLPDPCMLTLFRYLLRRSTRKLIKSITIGDHDANVVDLVEYSLGVPLTSFRGLSEINLIDQGRLNLGDQILRKIIKTFRLKCLQKINGRHVSEPLTDGKNTEESYPLELRVEERRVIWKDFISQRLRRRLKKLDEEYFELYGERVLDASGNIINDNAESQGSTLDQQPEPSTAVPRSVPRIIIENFNYQIRQPVSNVLCRFCRWWDWINSWNRNDRDTLEGLDVP